MNPILDKRTFDIIQEELFPGVFDDEWLPLPAIQSVLEMAMYLGFDVSANVRKVENVLSGRGISFELAGLEKERELLQLIDKFDGTSLTEEFETRLDSLRKKLNQ